MTDYATLLQELDRAAATHPTAHDISLYAALLKLQARIADLAAWSPLSQQDAIARWQQGQPLLVADLLHLSAKQLAASILQIIAVTARHRPDLADRLMPIEEWVRERQALLPTLAQEYLRENRLAAGDETALDGQLLTFVFNHALHPHLRLLAEETSTWFDERLWYRGYCPVCGGEADFAALTKDSGARRLLCSRCDMEWAFHRTICPFCGDEDHVAYYPSEVPYRLYVCDACRRYIKTIDLREIAEEWLLPVERILTIGMDAAAQAAGWRAS